MRKSLIFAITGVLLVAAVLFTAGCVDAPADPIAGDWIGETEISVTYAVFENDCSGYFAVTAETEEKEAKLMANFEWKAEGSNIYTLAYADGKTETAVLDAEHGILTIGDVVFQKYPSGLSGAAKHMGFFRAIAYVTADSLPSDDCR